MKSDRSKLFVPRDSGSSDKSDLASALGKEP